MNTYLIPKKWHDPSPAAPVPSTESNLVTRGRSRQRLTRRATSEQARGRRTPPVRVRAKTLDSSLSVYPPAPRVGRGPVRLLPESPYDAAYRVGADPSAESDPRAHATALHQALEAVRQATKRAPAPPAVHSVAAVGVALIVGNVLRHASVSSLDALAHGDVPMRRGLANVVCAAAWFSYLPPFTHALEAAETDMHDLYEHIGSMLAAMAWVAARQRVHGGCFLEQAWLLVSLSAHTLPTMHQWIRGGLALQAGRGRATLPTGSCSTPSEA